MAAFLAEEVAGFIVCGFGVYYLLLRKEKLLGAALIFLGAAGVTLITQLIIPRFNTSGVFPFSGYYSHFGSNTAEQIINIITHPVHTLGFLFTPANILYVFLLLAPLAFLPLFYPRLLVIGSVNKKPSVWTG